MGAVADFNEQQRVIIDGFGQGQAVIAGAGCGKTTTLVAKCVKLLELKPKARFCAVSFTEKSVRDLKQSLAEKFQGHPKFNPHDHWVKTIHGLCFAILQEFPEAAGLAGGEKILMEDEAARLWSRSLEPLWSEDGHEELNPAIERLLMIYSRDSLETLLSKLRSLEAFGVREWIERQSHSNPGESSVLVDLWRVFESVQLRFLRLKQRAGALDFNDLEVKALLALEQARVRSYYQKRFELVMVDEFQDTNPVQGRILEKFVRGDLSNLCIVGDPKQSIYRFRDADVTVFEDLTRNLPLKHPLSMNYRSRPAVIDFVNQICEPLFVASKLEYEPLIAHREPAEVAAPVRRVEVETPQDLAEYLWHRVQMGDALQDFVILARSVKKDQTLAYLEGLEAAGIPYLFGSGGRFFSDARVIELVAFLKGWLSKHNSLSQATALRAPWIQVADTDLLKWRDRGPENRNGDLFAGFFADSTHPVAQALRAEYQSRKPLRPGEILKILWGLPTMPDEMLLTLATLWQKVEDLSMQGRRFADIVQQLQEWVDREKIEADVPPPSQQGAVRVMTVHASKGLQFPHVVLIDFEKPSKPDGRKDLIWNRREGVYLFARDELGKKIDGDLHSDNARWNDIERQADVAESKRVFYVALTRAQETLSLIWPLQEKEQFKDAEIDIHRDFWRAWVHHLAQASRLPCSRPADYRGAVPPRIAAPSSTSPTRQLKKLNIRTEPFRPRHSPSEWLVLHQCPLRYYFQYTAGAVDGLDEDAAEEAPLIQRFDFTETVTETVAEKGERVHAAIETEAWDALAEEFKDPKIAANVVDRLRTLLQEEASLDGARVFKEVGFEVPFTEDEALVGFMDRLVIVDRPDQIQIRVTDYKWTAAPRSPEALLEHYGLQLQVYAWAAMRMLQDETQGRKVTLHARLVHLTDSGLEVVDADSSQFQVADLQSLVESHFKQAKKLLFETREAPIEQAQPGKHCRHCPQQAICPKAAS
jgi:ATP-dependent exoDNAse (exonuclease V) beta subunit